MREWKSVFANDPLDDYKLVIELEYDGVQIGYIKKVNEVLELIIFPSSENIVLPLTWLNVVIDKAKTNLK